MTRLLMLRHGPTAWNEAGRIQGRSDPPLSSRGRAGVAAWVLPPQAAGARWLCSPLARARETAAILHRGSVEIEPRLVETDWGEWEGQTLPELRAALGEAMAANEARGLDFRPPGGESPREVQDRLRPLLTDLAEWPQTVVAVSHKGVLRALYALACGWDLRGRPPAKLRDGCAHLFVIAPDGQPAIEHLNMPLGESPAMGSAQRR